MELTFRRIAEIAESGVPAVLVTVVDVYSSAPRGAGARMVVLSDTTEGTVGGGELELYATHRAREFLSEKNDFFIVQRINLKDMGMECGGESTLAFESLTAPPRLVIFGGGHIGASLCKIGKEAGFSPIVCDDRPDLLTADRFPDAIEMMNGAYPELVDRVKLTRSDYVAILTHGHREDGTVLRLVLSQEIMPRYVGMIGSPKKIKTNFETARKAGVSDDRLARVHSPIGLNIGIESRGEIAVAIAAEMLAEKNNIEEIVSCSKSNIIK